MICRFGFRFVLVLGLFCIVVIYYVGFTGLCAIYLVCLLVFLNLLALRVCGGYCALLFHLFFVF